MQGFVGDEFAGKSDGIETQFKVQVFPGRDEKEQSLPAVFPLQGGKKQFMKPEVIEIQVALVRIGPQNDLHFLDLAVLGTGPIPVGAEFLVENRGIRPGGLRGGDFEREGAHDKKYGKEKRTDNDIFQFTLQYLKH
jgi:hypothetical protein